MDRTDYWMEAVESALSEHGVSATPEQIAAVTRDIECSHENIGLAFHTPESPYPGEIRALTAALKAEREKVQCRTCAGEGVLVTYGGTYESRSQCWKCNGEGRVTP